MKVTTKTIIEFTTKELETVRDFIKIFNDDEELDHEGTWDIMKSILDGDIATLRDYGYYVDIK